jgi:hypothetical protein
MIDLSTALKAYNEKFGDVDYITHPSLIANEELPLFIMDLVEKGTKATPEIISDRFGPISWEW